MSVHRGWPLIGLTRFYFAFFQHPVITCVPCSIIKKKLFKKTMPYLRTTTQVLLVVQCLNAAQPAQGKFICTLQNGQRIEFTSGQSESGLVQFKPIPTGLKDMAKKKGDGSHNNTSTPIDVENSPMQETKTTARSNLKLSSTGKMISLGKGAIGASMSDLAWDTILNHIQADQLFQAQKDFYTAQTTIMKEIINYNMQASYNALLNAETKLMQEKEIRPPEEIKRVKRIRIWGYTRAKRSVEKEEDTNAKW